MRLSVRHLHAPQYNSCAKFHRFSDDAYRQEALKDRDTITKPFYVFLQQRRWPIGRVERKMG